MVLSDKVRGLLQKEADPEYKEFTYKLTPGLDKDKMIGVRFPALNKICKQLSEEERRQYMTELPHIYFEENNLHSVIISHIKDEDECIAAIEAFMPYIDNWSTSDTISPSVFKKHKQKLIVKIKEWVKSDRVYTVRIGVLMLMKFFLNDDFKPGYNDLVADIRSEEYYVNMMCAWYFATALAKRYEEIIPVICERRLDPWTHNMTIKKAAESYRITDERKEFLKSLKVPAGCRTADGRIQ